MIEAAICDDEREDAEKLAGCLCENFPDVHTEIFTEADKFLSDDREYDVIFLDYSMPELTGEELAVALREKGIKSLLVFFTASQEPTPEIFRVEPFRYLLKGMEPDKLIRELEEIINKCHERRAAHYIYAGRREILSGSPYTTFPILSSPSMAVRSTQCVTVRAGSIPSKRIYASWTGN